MAALIIIYLLQILAIVFGGLSTPVQASDFHSPRTAALGGAGHAGPLLNDALYLNPSFTSFLPSYSFSGNYGWYGADDNSFHGSIVNASLLDGTSEMFQAGVGFTRREDLSLIHIGASKAFVNRYGVGIGAKIMMTHEQSSVVSENFTASFTFIANTWFQVVAVVDNLIENQFALQYNFYREFIIGTKFNVMQIAMVYFDPHLVPDLPGGSAYGHEIGLELTPFQDLFIRFGQFTNSKIPSLNVYGNGFGVGLGWLFPKLSVDYGLERSTTPIATVTNMIGATIYF